MSENWWDAIAATDIDSQASCQAALEAIEAAVKRYQEPITAMLNCVPDIDKPIFLACLKLTFDAVKSTDRYAAEVIDAILALPIQTVAVVQHRPQRGGRGDGV